MFSSRRLCDELTDGEGDCSFEAASGLTSSSSSSEKITVTKAEISGLFNRLLNLNMADCTELFIEEPDSSEGCEDGEAMASGDMHLGAGLPHPPNPPLRPELRPRLGIPLR